MKIAVYCIAKNEEAFIARWAASADAADVRLVVDTGSDDHTVAAAEAAGCEVRHIAVTPWRFDHARNAALDLLPDDIDLCIALDADEVLQPGWREALEAQAAGLTRPRYHYVWSWNADGSPGLTYGGDKIHARHGYTWQHPVHETLVCSGEERQGWIDGLEIHHHPDNTKSRGQYLPLLELAAQESPDDDRIAHYLGREYVYAGRYAEAAAELRRHLSLPAATWGPERAQSCLLLAQCDPDRADDWIAQAQAEAPHRREPWVAGARRAYERHAWPDCYDQAMRALDIASKPQDYICEPWAWGALPWDLAALAAHHLGQRVVAEALGARAVLLDPSDQRLYANLAYYSAGSTHA